MEITEKMIDEFEKAFSQKLGRKEAVTSGLSAALSAAPVAVKAHAKDLEWKKIDANDRKAEKAETILGTWEVWQFPQGGVYIMKAGEHQGSVFEGCYEEAKVHLERAYQFRIAPALSPAPVSAEPDLAAEIARLKAELEVREGDLHMLKRAIEEDDPKSELLVRVNDALLETRAALADQKGPRHD